jgi:hypothetical protein
MTYRLLFAYAFVRLESEQKSSHPTFPRAPQSGTASSAAEIKPPVEDSATAMVSRRAFRRAAIVSASGKRSFNGSIPLLRFLRKS